MSNDYLKNNLIYCNLLEHISISHASVSKEMHNEFIGFPCKPGSRSSDPGLVILDNTTKFIYLHSSQRNTTFHGAFLSCHKILWHKIWWHQVGVGRPYDTRSCDTRSCGTRSCDTRTCGTRSCDTRLVLWHQILWARSRFLVGTVSKFLEAS